MVVVIIVASNYQKEVGIVEPGKGGREAVAAAAEARSAAASEVGLVGYDAFSKALVVAEVATRNMPITNAAEIRLKHALEDVLDCLRASREAWYADLEQTWDPAVQGSPRYWQTLHPGLLLDGPLPETLDAAQVREWSAGDHGAGHWLADALDLVS